MKVDILVPRYRVVFPDADRAIGAMAGHAKAQGIDVRMPDVVGTALINKVRNLALTKIRTDCDYVLFCDDDMFPQPDALMKLLRHNKPVASALCTTRDQWPPKLCLKIWEDEKQQFALVDEVRDGASLYGKFAPGTGFLLISKQTVDRLIEHYLSASDWMEFNRPIFDRLHVRKEWRERERERIVGLRRHLWESEQYHRVFDFGVVDEIQYGEDIWLGLLLLQLNVQVVIDTTCLVGHLGNFPYSPRLLGYGSWKEVRQEDFAA